MCLSYTSRQFSAKQVRPTSSFISHPRSCSRFDRDSVTRRRPARLFETTQQNEAQPFLHILPQATQFDPSKAAGEGNPRQPQASAAPTLRPPPPSRMIYRRAYAAVAGTPLAAVVRGTNALHRRLQHKPTFWGSNLNDEDRAGHGGLPTVRRLKSNVASWESPAPPPQQRQEEQHYDQQAADTLR